MVEAKVSFHFFLPSLCQEGKKLDEEMDTGPPDARELAAFTELEGKLVNASRRVKTVRCGWNGE